MRDPGILDPRHFFFPRHFYTIYAIFTRFTRFLHDFMWFLHNFTRFLRFLHDFTRFLRNFTWFLHDLTRFLRFSRYFLPGKKFSIPGTKNYFQGLYRATSQHRGGDQAWQHIDQNQWGTLTSNVNLTSSKLCWNHEFKLDFPFKTEALWCRIMGYTNLYYFQQTLLDRMRKLRPLIK